MRMSSLPRARTLLAAAALIVGGLSSAHAVSFTLAAQSGDTWTYTLTYDALRVGPGGGTVSLDISARTTVRPPGRSAVRLVLGVARPAPSEVPGETSPSRRPLTNTSSLSVNEIGANMRTKIVNNALAQSVARNLSNRSIS